MYYAMQAEQGINDWILKKGVTAKFVMPDISTKAKAQQYIGLDIPKEKAAKEKFLKDVVPQWLQKAKEKGLLITKN